ncbi:MAG: chemotaxis protein CheW [Solirubrobacteraceae bacterium]
MTAAESERQLVVFSLHGELYGLPIALVREIIRYTAPMATATTSALVRGMISLRGRVVPIVDLSNRLDKQLEIAGGTRIVVIELRRGPLGLIVDSVEGVWRIPAAQIEPLPVPVGTDGLGREIAAVGEHLVMLLDAEKALAAAFPARAPRRRRTTG